MLDLIFPKICAACQARLLPNEGPICLGCQFTLPFTHQHLAEKHELHAIFDGKYQFPHASSYLYFEKSGPVQELMHQLKYKGQQEIGSFFGQLYGLQLRDVPVLSDLSGVVPVPLHPARLKKRGYNQVQKFAETLAATWQIPVCSQLLVKTENRVSQTRKNLLNRLINTQSVFRLGHASMLPPEAHVLLVDDIVTTGATLISCLSALQEVPNLRVSLVTMAMTVH
ncbi:MAG: amidophosphoribosyltransferase [Flavobacterium sp. BFFFF2]|nr:MAG: amidophosphoribosyltransferase [Flavobacterium sp. BFFFF2]